MHPGTGTGSLAVYKSEKWYGLVGRFCAPHTFDLDLRVTNHLLGRHAGSGGTNDAGVPAPRRQYSSGALPAG